MWILSVAAWSAPSDARDFDQFWRFVDQNYPYFAARHTDWDAVRTALAPAAAAATTRDELMAVLEDALDQLYDPHCMLNTNNNRSWRPVPHGVYAEWRDGRAVVTAVQGGSAAEAAGVVAGDEVLEVDGADVATVVDQRRPRFLRSPDPAADEWALLSAVAGRHGEHALGVRHADGTVAQVALSGESNDPPPLSWSRLDPNLGRIQIHSFGDPALVARFDQALTALAGVDGLVIDLRSNSGGDTDVALPMLGRLFSEPVPYAWMARRKGDGLGRRWSESFAPRGVTVDLPVVVVVDRFTVSMGEGFAMAIQETGRGTIVGTGMGQLGAAIARVKLKGSGISAQISAEPIWTADGRPRDDLVPDVVVDPAAGGDPFLVAAIAVLTAARP